MKKYYLLYVLNNLEKEIKGFEEERLEKDIRNIYRLQPLYELYRKNQKLLEELE